MISLVIICLLVAHKVEIGYAGYKRWSGGMEVTLSSELVDELRLPVEHDVFLMLNGFFLFK